MVLKCSRHRTPCRAHAPGTHTSRKVPEEGYRKSVHLSSWFRISASLPVLWSKNLFPPWPSGRLEEFCSANMFEATRKYSLLTSSRVYSKAVFFMMWYSSGNWFSRFRCALRRERQDSHLACRAPKKLVTEAPIKLGYCYYEDLDTLQTLIMTHYFMPTDVTQRRE